MSQFISEPVIQDLKERNLSERDRPHQQDLSSKHPLSSKNPFPSSSDPREQDPKSQVQSRGERDFKVETTAIKVLG